jgi:hypothetical protein
MLHTKLIRDLNEMRTLAFSPPHTLMESIADAERRGEKWGVIMALERNSEDARWVTLLPVLEESQFFSDGERLKGRWDPEHEIFIPKSRFAFRPPWQACIPVLHRGGCRRRGCGRRGKKVGKCSSLRPRERFSFLGNWRVLSVNRPSSSRDCPSDSAMRGSLLYEKMDPSRPC